MRISAIVAMILFMCAAAQAEGDAPWCYRDVSGPQYSNCTYPSARQCLAAAGLIGGVCERNHAQAKQRVGKTSSR